MISIIHALKWSFLSEFVAKAIQPIIFIILARLLTPEDYGVMSSAIMIIAFSQVFWEAGMGKALIQSYINVDDAANAAFWINIILGLIISITLYITAPQIADIFFHDNRVSSVLRVMTLQVILGAASSVPNALMQKQMGFKKLFWVRFATVSFPGLASIPLALSGMGYWALVAGTIFGQAVQVSILWWLSCWRPVFKLNKKIVADIAKFGSWVSISGLLIWFYMWADSLIIGMYLGSHDLGLYRTGNQFSSMVYIILFGPVTPVLYSQLSKLNAANKDISLIVEKMIVLFMNLSIPIGFIIFSLQNEIEKYVFGPLWLGVGNVIGFMALSQAISYVTCMNAEAYRASGKPKYETFVLAIPIPVYITVYLTLVNEGLYSFLIGRICVALFTGTLMHLWAAKRLYGIKSYKVIIRMIYVSLISGLFVGINHFFYKLIAVPLIASVIAVVFGGIIVFSILFFTQKDDLTSFIKFDLKKI